MDISPGIIEGFTSPSYQFFEIDQTKVGTGVNHSHHNEKRKHVFCMISGRMAPNQKKIEKNHCVINTHQYCELSKWFIEELGHPGL